MAYLALVVLFVAASFPGSMGVSAAQTQVSTEAPITLLAGPGNNDGTVAVMGDGTLELVFGRSGGEVFGIAPWSTYTWESLFIVSNDSGDDLDICIDATGEITEFITLRGPGESGAWYSGLDIFPGPSTGCTELTLPGNGELPLSVDITTPKDAELGTYNGEITIEVGWEEEGDDEDEDEDEEEEEEEGEETGEGETPVTTPPAPPASAPQPEPETAPAPTVETTPEEPAGTPLPNTGGTYLPLILGGIIVVMMGLYLRGR